MTSDDQHFLDILGGVSKDVRNFGASAFDVADRQIDALASSIRSALSTSWLPKSIQSNPPPTPPSPVSAGYWDRVTDWIARHKALTAAAVAFVGTGGAMVYYQRMQGRRRRRAKRMPNGARTEIVVLAGPAGSPVTKSLMLDLERRGFLVYVVVHTLEEEDMIKAEAVGRTDIRPFLINIADPIETQEALSRFRHLLQTRHHAFAGAKPHNLSFTGVVLAPDLAFQSGPTETIPLEIWSDALNTKVVATIAVAQAFLPSICEYHGRLIILTPNVVSSLRPAFHGLESTVIGALDGFATTLRRELHTLGIIVSQIRLGAFDFSHVGSGPRHHLQTATANSSRTLTWPPSARRLYAQNFMNQTRVAESQGLFSGGENGSIAKATSPRELNHTVFDALTHPRPQNIYRVGRGSLAYDIIGQWVPGGVVGWALGLRKVNLEESNGSAPSLSPAADLDSSYNVTTNQGWEKVDRD